MIKHNVVELLTGSKWEVKEEYPYSFDIYLYSILAVEKKFILFGGLSRFRQILINRDQKFLIQGSLHRGMKSEFGV